MSLAMQCVDPCCDESSSSSPSSSSSSSSLSSSSSTSTNECQYCTPNGNAPTQLQVTISGLADCAAAGNGTYILDRIQDCAWRYQFPSTFPCEGSDGTKTYTHILGEVNVPIGLIQHASVAIYTGFPVNGVSCGHWSKIYTINNVPCLAWSNTDFPIRFDGSNSSTTLCKSSVRTSGSTCSVTAIL